MNCRHFLSNRLEALIPHLRKNLFEEQKSPFSERFLIIPSIPMEKWIQIQLASENGIAAGFRPYFLHEAIEKLSERFLEKKNEKSFPSSYALQLNIEHEIRRILKEERDVPLWNPILSYLDLGRGNFKKLRGLSKHLALLFQRYSVYGGHVTLEWKQCAKEWQEALWARVFQKWEIASEKLSQEIIPSVGDDLSIHLFAFSHLSSLHMNFFSQLGQHIPVVFYHLSPCQEFWSDIRSDREVRSFFSQKTMSESLRLRWEELLEEKHPFLANLGKVGRECALLIEEYGKETIECYVDPGFDTQLASLQSEILRLQKKKDISFSEKDHSIQFHISSTCHREVQNLYNFLVGLMEEKGIEPKDVLVMAPDITLYVPFIQALFGKELPYRISDIPLAKTNLHFEGLFALLALEDKRWSASAVLDLFFHPLFSKRQGWTLEDLLLIRKWVFEADIRWGIDFEHRKELLGDPQIEDGGNGTWMQGINRLFCSLAEAPSEREKINFTQCELLADLVLTLRSLREDIAFFQKGRELSLKEWCSHLIFLNEKYFGYSEDKESFFSWCDFLEKVDRKQCLAYPFETVFSLFKEIVSQEVTTIHGNQLQSIHFCSLMPMRAIPAKVICLLGMNEGIFPRRDKFQSLDLLKKQNQGDFFPSRSDFDRYLFLEALLAARDYFYVSYLSHSPVDQTEIAPSSVVQELKSSLKTAYQVIHPAQPFDHRYFDGSSPSLKNYSESDYRAATVLLSPPLKMPRSPISLPTLEGERIDFLSPPNSSSSEPCTSHDAYPNIFGSARKVGLATIQVRETVVLEIEELLRCVRRPLRHYFRHALRLRIFDEEKRDEEEAFTFSPFFFSSLQKEALKASMEDVFFKLSREGKWPGGLFRKAASLRIEEQFYSYDQSLLKLGIDKKQFITLELCPHQQSAERKEAHYWKLPALEFTYEGLPKVKVVGKIERVSSQGWIAFEHEDVKGAIRAWPIFLILQLLLPMSPFPMNPLLIFGKDGSKKEPFSLDSEYYFGCLLDFYFNCHNVPSFLFPDWAESIFKKEATKLEKLIEKKLDPKEKKHFLTSFPMRDLQWLQRRGSLPTASEIIHKEEKTVNVLYGDMIRAWF